MNEGDSKVSWIKQIVASLLNEIKSISPFSSLSFEKFVLSLDSDFENHVVSDFEKKNDPELVISYL